MNYFTFDGIDSRTYNTYIATSNAFDAPGREDEVIKVPGSNNIYYLTEGTYKPFDIKLYCYIPSNMQVKTDDLRNFLLSKGTCTYTEAIRPNEFRVARFIEAYELDVSDRVSAAFVLTFKAQPQRYLTTNTPITTTATADTTTDTTMSLSTVPTPINISLNGNTTQEGSSGKNIFDYKYWVDNITVIRGTKTVNGNSITITATDTDSYTNYRGTYEVLFPKVTTNTDYTLSWDRDSGSARGLIYVFDEGGSAITSVQSTAKKVTFNSGSNTFIQFRFGVQASGNSITYSNIMLEKGSTATAYEPHISPTNPQTIHNVSGDNTVFVSGKNMWGGTKMVSDIKKALPNATADFTNNIITFGANTDGNVNPNLTADITFKPTTDYTIIMSVSSNSATASTNMRVLYTDGTIEYINKPQALASKQTFAFHPNRLNKSIQCIQKVWASGVSTFYADECGIFEGNVDLEDFEVFGAQSYPLYLPVENYFDINTVYADTSHYTIDGDSVKSNYFAGARRYISSDLVGKALTFQAYIITNSTSVNVRVQANVGGSDKNGNYITAGAEGLSTVTFTPTSTSDYVRITYSDTGGIITAKNIQLEIGSKANHYTPYGTTPIELNKIGTYQDYIYKNGGKWYVHKETQKFNIYNSVYTYSTSLNNDVRYFMASIGAIGGALSVNILSGAYSNRFINEVGVILGHFYITNNGQTLVFVTEQTVTTSDELKTWLLSNPTEIAIPLATPTNTEITDTTLINQLNNIEKAYSYNGTTNILQVSNDNPFMLEVVSLHSNDVSSDYKGEPIITVNSTGLIYFNGCVIKVNQAPMTINSQTMQAYNGTVNLNNYIEANDFPMIEVGNNVIGSEMPLSIVPNYWKL